MSIIFDVLALVNIALYAYCLVRYVVMLRTSQRQETDTLWTIFVFLVLVSYVLKFVGRFWVPEQTQIYEWSVYFIRSAMTLLVGLLIAALNTRRLRNGHG